MLALIMRVSLSLLDDYHNYNYVDITGIAMTMAMASRQGPFL